MPLVSSSPTLNVSEIVRPVADHLLSTGARSIRAATCGAPGTSDTVGKIVSAATDHRNPPLTTRSRLTRLFASWAGVGMGIPLILRAELGASPFDVLNTGLGETSGWSFGLCFVINSVVFFAVGRAMGARLGWACIAGTLVIGPIVNVVLELIPEQERLVTRIPMLGVGLLVIAVSICLVIPTELGPGPTEVLMLGLVARGMDVVPARWISDGLPVAIGAVMGGAFGVGTAIWVLCMGPLVKYGLRRMHYVPPRLAVDRG